MKHTDDKITEMLNNRARVRLAIQKGINAALLRHKQAGNPICEWKNNQVVWINPENIRINKE